MPYKSDEDLPERVKENLPEHAQHIFKKAFNSAWEQYEEPEERREEESREEVSFKVAWDAVKSEYHKEGDRWVRKGGYEGEEREKREDVTGKHIED